MCNTPKFCKACPISFTIKDVIRAKLNHLEEEGILQRVSHSDWAAPIVSIPKKDGKFRICEDYKVTVDGALDVDQYSLPKPTDLFVTLAGGLTDTPSQSTMTFADHYPIRNHS